MIRLDMFNSCISWTGLGNVITPDPRVFILVDKEVHKIHKKLEIVSEYVKYQGKIIEVVDKIGSESYELLLFLVQLEYHGKIIEDKNGRVYIDYRGELFDMNGLSKEEKELRDMFLTLVKGSFKTDSTLLLASDYTPGLIFVAHYYYLITGRMPKRIMFDENSNVLGIEEIPFNKELARKIKKTMENLAKALTSFLSPQNDKKIDINEIIPCFVKSSNVQSTSLVAFFVNKGITLATIYGYLVQSKDDFKLFFGTNFAVNWSEFISGENITHPELTTKDDLEGIIVKLAKNSNIPKHIPLNGGYVLADDKEYEIGLLSISLDDDAITANLEKRRTSEKESKRIVTQISLEESSNIEYYIICPKTQLQDITIAVPTVVLVDKKRLSVISFALDYTTANIATIQKIFWSLFVRGVNPSFIQKGYHIRRDSQWIDYLVEIGAVSSISHGIYIHKPPKSLIKQIQLNKLKNVSSRRIQIRFKELEVPSYVKKWIKEGELSYEIHIFIISPFCGSLTDEPPYGLDPQAVVLLVVDSTKRNIFRRGDQVVVALRGDISA
ncbi:hypothetical protein [Thermococcus sp. LS2]|uniref:hypothetical protein n=1 Tax=Thermococcus sp. LS2 TaxID=1638260 RepID=UPI00143B6C50|nr:hypothetical protein [Thermococcus sp. LS2]NJE11886.1 hypothetical protein [Thermococcus sp. LS2]